MISRFAKIKVVMQWKQALDFAKAEVDKARDPALAADAKVHQKAQELLRLRANEYCFRFHNEGLVSFLQSARHYPVC